ncbi:MAG: ABC transporter ATP-binding protein [FCB group bacterium]|nr:ABC transporter ATP-binding protein [FCB group bacterium]
MLIADHISKTYRNGVKALPVLTDVSLALKPGTIATIMGPSGSGKSTLLNILGTLDQPDSGSLHFQDNDLLTLPNRELARFRNQHLGFVFQFHHLLPEFTARENALIPATIARNPDGERIVDDLFHLMGLREREDHYPGELSGGERVRVALVRALINQPEIILADEPTGNLDQGNAAKVLDLFRSVQERYHPCVVITTHNPEVAAIGDQKHILDQGTLFPVDSI